MMYMYARNNYLQTAAKSADQPLELLNFSVVQPFHGSGRLICRCRGPRNAVTEHLLITSGQVTLHLRHLSLVVVTR